MLDWSMLDLARAAGVSLSTVKHAEDGRTDVVSPAMLGLINEALESAGVQLLADDGRGPGVRLLRR